MGAAGVTLAMLATVAPAAFVASGQLQYHTPAKTRAAMLGGGG
jgi:hypothetical protein